MLLVIFLLWIGGRLATEKQSFNEGIREKLLEFYPMGVSLSPDGSFLLTKTRGTETFDLHVIEADTGKLVAETASGVTQLSLSWSPDSSTIAYLQDGGGDRLFNLHLWRPKETRLISVPSLETYTAAPAMRWSPDSNSLLVYVGGADSGSLSLVGGLRTSEYGTQSLGKVAVNGDFQWRPDGLAIALVRNTATDTVSIIHAHEHLSEASITVAPGAHINSLSWSPHGTSILAIARRPKDEYYSLFQVDIATGTSLQIYAPKDDLSNVTWTPDGEYFVVEENKQGRIEITLGEIGVHGTRNAISTNNESQRIVGLMADGSSLQVKGGAMSDAPIISKLSLTGEKLPIPNQAHVTAIPPLMVNIPTSEAASVPTIIWPSTKSSTKRAVLFLHGGPHQQELPILDGKIGVPLLEGMAVVVPNFRGSTGFGASWEAEDDITRQADDIYAVVRYMHETLRVPLGEITLLTSSHGMRPGLLVAEKTPESFRRIVLTSIVSMPMNLCPLKSFKGEIFGFHGKSDPLVSASAAKSIFLNCAATNSLRSWRTFSAEGHHIHGTSSWGGILQAVVAP